MFVLGKSPIIQRVTGWPGRPGACKRAPHEPPGACGPKEAAVIMAAPLCSALLSRPFGELLLPAELDSSEGPAGRRPQ